MSPTVAPFRAWRGSATSRRPEPYRSNDCDLDLSTYCGGERGIRTLGTFRYTRFPIVLLRPLGHLSQRTGGLAEREGFEPPVPLRVHLISNQAQSTGLC